MLMKGAKVNVRNGSYEKKRITDGGGRGSQKRNSLWVPEMDEWTFQGRVNYSQKSGNGRSMKTWKQACSGLKQRRLLILQVKTSPTLTISYVCSICGKAVVQWGGKHCSFVIWTRKQEARTPEEDGVSQHMDRRRDPQEDLQAVLQASSRLQTTTV